VWLTGETDWQEIGELVTDSYRVLAPKKLTALLDESALAVPDVSGHAPYLDLSSSALRDCRYGEVVQ